MIQYILTTLWGCILLYYIFIFITGKNMWRVFSYVPSILTLIGIVSFIVDWFLIKNYPIISLSSTFSAVALFLSLLYLFIERKLRSKNIGFIFIGFIFLLNIISLLLINFKKIEHIFSNTILLISHVTLSIIAYSIFIFASILGILYLLLFSVLKSKKFGIIYHRLPSLEVLEELNFKSSIIGFIFLSIGLTIGYMWKFLFDKHSFTFDAKIYTTGLLWLFFAIYTFNLKHIMPKTRAYLSILGVCFILISIFLGNFFTNFHYFR